MLVIDIAFGSCVTCKDNLLTLIYCNLDIFEKMLFYGFMSGIILLPFVGLITENLGVKHEMMYSHFKGYSPEMETCCLLG
jgi:hypothetical protein